MKIALINDIHIGIKNDVQYMIEYQKKFFDDIFFPYLIENKINIVLMGGDLFDRRKYVNFKTLNYSKQFFFDKLKDNNIEMICIPGNHDVHWKNSNDINSIQELLYGYDNIDFLSEPTTLEYDGINIDMIPWINTENYEKTMDFIQNSSSNILYGHLEIAGFEMYAGMKNEHGMDRVSFKKYDQVWTGHFHHKSQQNNIHYLGAPMEFTFADCDDPRGFHVFDTENNTLEFIKNPYILFEKIYYDDENDVNSEWFRKCDTSQFKGKIIKLFVTKKTKPAIFEFFVDKLYQEDLINLIILEDYSEFTHDDIDIDSLKQKTTKELIDEYIDTVETDMNKKRIKSILNSVYIEAMDNNEFI